MNRKRGYKQVRQVDREEMKEYGEYFKYMRKSIGLTQVQMGKEVGACKHSIYRWENAIRIPKMDIEELVHRYREVVKRYRDKVS